MLDDGDRVNDKQSPVYFTARIKCSMTLFTQVNVA